MIKSWRSDLRLYPDERSGYFRWGDEPPGRDDQPGRVFNLDNLGTVTTRDPALPVGRFGPGGESAAHRLLKLYAADHPVEFGMSAAAVPHVEYSFATGDRVDVMFKNHLPDRTVVEVEVEGERQLCIGIHQAIKCWTLAAADAGYPLLTSRVRSVVVAYSTDYPKTRDLTERYEIPLLTADRETELDEAWRLEGRRAASTGFMKVAILMAVSRSHAGAATMPSHSCCYPGARWHLGARPRRFTGV